MAEPRIASRAPVACAACYGQYPERTHIDFRSAIEGAPINDNPRAPRVDWVTICDQCIRTAFEMLPEQASQRTNLEAQLKAALERAEAAENYASRVEDALSHRPELPTSREPRAPRPPKTSHGTKRPGAGQSRPQGAARRNRYANDGA